MSHHDHHEHHHRRRRGQELPASVLQYQLGRRMFLTELGRRTFAVTILGAGLISCSGDDSSQSSSTTTQRSTESDPTTTATPSTEAAAPALEWERVNLGFVSAYVLVRGKEAAVVDTGVAGSEPQIAAALDGLGFGWGDVDHVVLTHYHPDHAGSIGAVLDAATGATAYAGEADISGIQSPRPLTALGDGDEVFGLQVIATPGHTAGHICVLDAETGLLVAGDALNHTEAAIGGSPPQFTADQAEAEASVQKLAGLDFDTVVFGHGDPVEGDAQEQVAALAATL